MNKLKLLLVSTICVVAVGCQSNSPQQTNEIPASETANTAVSILEIKPGLYSHGDEYDQLEKLLSESKCQIRLDAHTGIGWNSQTLENIDDLMPLLKSTENKNVLLISTGKVMWDKEQDYIDIIVARAQELGYNMTVVVDDHSSGILVRNAYLHE